MKDEGAVHEGLEPRHRSGNERDRVAEDRDRDSAVSDVLADARDMRAYRRDHRAETREMLAGHSDVQTSHDRAAARRDRQDSADERARSSSDRLSSGSDRVLSARERTEYLVDELTGAHRRTTGLFELERELMRATRTGQPYTLVFIDVDGLKAVNDLNGHSAGDELLVLVVDTIRNHVRQYDLLIRYGGDEFLCGLLGLGMAEVSRRIDLVNAELHVGGGSSVTAGFAEVGEDEPLADLIRRADGDLYARRREQRSFVGELN
jgi:diguanylate cyclase (GGDEF)-like protein